MAGLPQAPRFTVFTPTYNRAHTLLRPYQSLCAQQFRDFEWLIVDDGSTDGTPDLVAEWIVDAKLRIHYVRQENGGKHRAFNRGVRLAKGELFVPLDSDDWCTPEALARFDFHWQNIPDAEKNRFSGIGCLCCNENGELVGSRFSESPLDASLLSVLCAGLVGEKWGCHRTEVLRRFPFPEFPGERFVPEALVWNRIALEYQMRFVNEGLRVYADTGDGLTASILPIRVASPLGARLYYCEAARLPLGIRYRAQAWLNFGRFSVHAGVPLLRSLREMGLMWGLPAYAGGALLAWRDSVQLKRNQRHV